MTDSRSERTDAPSSESRSALGSPTQEVFYGVLADRRRRYVVESLGECQTPIAVADLAGEVATRERAAPTAEISAEERERVSISLHHVHLPKLADWNVVEYDRERREVALSTEGERVESFVDDVTDVLL